MNSHERVSMLLNKQLPDRMALFDHFWPETIPGWENHGFPKETAPELYFNYDIAPYGDWINTEPFPSQKEVVEENAEWEVFLNGRGATLKAWKTKSGTPEHIAFDVTNPEKWEKYREPLLDLNLKRFGDLKQFSSNMAKIRVQGKYAVFGNASVFELLRATVGDEHFLPALILEPDWIKDFCQVYVDFFIRHYEYLFEKIALPDAYWIYEDLGYRNGLFCSPELLKELIMPYEKKLIAFFKSYNLPVLLHTCGNVEKAIPLIIEAGFDCLQPMEAKAGMNVLDIAKTYGNKLSYMGNIDVTVLNTNNFKKIKEEIVPKLKVLKEMRIPYFFHSDHSIPPTVSFDTYQYVLELFNKHAYY